MTGKKYEHHLIGEMSSWIKTKKETLGSQIISPQDNTDVNTFNDKQRIANNIVKEHSEKACPKDPLLLILIGVAGTGKSYQINAIQNLLQQSCAITATTGKASYNINGCTILSLLKLPIASRGNRELTGQCLVRLKNNLKNISHIIIDEYSMLGQTLLGLVD